MIASYGLEVVQAYMGHIQDNSEEAVRKLVVSWSLAHGMDEVDTFGAVDYLDDGSPIRVEITIDRARRSIALDFAGTGPELWGNLNAPPAVVASAIIYVLRTLIDEDIPLNGGFLKPVTIRIPEGVEALPGFRRPAL